MDALIAYNNQPTWCALAFSRLLATEIGAYRADNVTPEGRQKNRRVEMKVVE